MNVQAEYRSKLRTPEEAVKVVKSGDWVDYGTNVGFPTLLDAALAKRRDELSDVKLRGNLLFGPIQTVECDPTREHFLYNSWHCSAYERKLCDKGLCNYIPMIFRNVVPYYRHFLTVNVAMLGVTPMDRHGYFNFSCSTGVARGIMEKADIVILATGQIESYGPEFFREGQIIVDAGAGTGSDGKMAGDLNAKALTACDWSENVAYTPVPGGVGTVTTTLLLRNVMKAAKHFYKKENIKNSNTK